MKRQQAGFTLIELVVVIIILSVLAAFALPRFINLGRDARVASVDGVAGNVRAAVAIVQSRYLATGITTAAGSPVTMLDGTTVAVTTGAAGGIPTAANTGIGNALQSGNNLQPVDGYNTTYAATTTIRPLVGGVAGTCEVQYVAATGAVTAQTGGC